MNAKIAVIMAFGAGVAIGAVSTLVLVKNKYEQMAEDQMEAFYHDVKKQYGIDESEEMSEDDEEDEPEPEMSVEAKRAAMVDYTTRLKELGYSQHNEDEETKNDEPEEQKKDRDYIYVIGPDEFGEYDTYATVAVTYYSDGKVADCMDELLSNLEDTVGIEFINHFGEYEDDEDMVHVRNDKHKIDYEIVRDPRTYEEVTSEE